MDAPDRRSAPGRALLRAAAVSGIVLLVALATRAVAFSPQLMWLETAVKLAALVLSAPAFAVLRALGLTSGHYLSAHDLGLLTALNLVFWTGLFLVLERPRRPRAMPRAALGRRAVLARGAALAGGLVFVSAAWHEREWLEVVPRELRLPGLPDSLDGLRVALVSDLHRGPYNSLDYLARAMREVNGLAPDLVLVPGDFVHVSGDYFEDAAEAVALLKPRLGVLGTLGNHDHWEGAHRARALLPRAGLRLLDNDRVFLAEDGALSADPPARGLCLGGVGDLWEDATDLEAATRGAPAGMPRLVMSHNPDLAETARESPVRVDLMLSGHTHGGQVSLPGLGTPFLPSRYGNRYASGLVQGPRWPVYVSRGLGTTILPLRFRVRPEITLFTLRA